LAYNVGAVQAYYPILREYGYLVNENLLPLLVQVCWPHVDIFCSAYFAVRSWKVYFYYYFTKGNPFPFPTAASAIISAQDVAGNGPATLDLLATLVRMNPYVLMANQLTRKNLAEKVLACSSCEHDRILSAIVKDLGEFEPPSSSLNVPVDTGVGEEGFVAL
jgi:hypothetical protein